MKKKTVILVILAILVLSSLTYAYSQNYGYPNRGRRIWGRNRMANHEFYGWEEDYRTSPRDYNRGYGRDSGDFRRNFRSHHRGFNRHYRNCRGW